MNSISLDFKNNRVCIMNAGQTGVEYDQLPKKDFLSFIPAKWQEYNSFTWNFEDETFAVNQDYTLPDGGAIMTPDCFVPIRIVSMPGLAKRYQEFIDCMGYEEVNLIEEMPPELRRFFGLE